jgi:Ca2+-binding RTX toxin-like protein
VLLGDTGNDTLIGGSGRDLLLGGSGASRLEATSMEDIVVAGTSAYDLTVPSTQTLAALDAIMAEWGRTDIDFLTRVGHLQGTLAGGLNGASFLNTSTVHDNGVKDTIVLSGQPEWVFLSAKGQDVDRKPLPGDVFTQVQ